MPVEPVLTPKARPAVFARPAPKPPSEASQELARYYRTVLRDGQTRGLLRIDGGGPDTPYTADMLVRNFEQIAFFSEYDRGNQPLRRWSRPVRITAHFGDSVDPAIQTRDTNALTGFAARLARVTGHPISTGRAGANFHVFFVSEDDRPAAVAKMRRIEPLLDDATVQTVLNLDKTTYCIVLALTEANDPSTYIRAIALIRTEQPDLLRLSCIHEEVSQGLGLVNDSPYARPSIYNDDDEFALLTSHDEKLLSMLYDPRLSNGMSAETARPILRILAREAMGADL